MFIGVYKITNNINGKIYIGRSKNIRQRWADHKKPSTWKKQKDKPLYLAFKKYGVENFLFDIIKFNNTPIESSISEHEFIKKFKPEYNLMSNYGNGFITHSKKTKIKMSDSAKGRIFTNETKAKLSKAHKGKIVSKETRMKQSKVHKGAVFSEEHKRKIGEKSKGNKYLLGFKHSDDAKKRIREANGKTVVRLLDNKKFVSIRNASKECGIDRKTIWNHCHNKVKNKKWKFYKVTEEK